MVVKRAETQELATEVSMSGQGNHLLHRDPSFCDYHRQLSSAHRCPEPAVTLRSEPRRLEVLVSVSLPAAFHPFVSWSISDPPSWPGRVWPSIVRCVNGTRV